MPRRARRISGSYVRGSFRTARSAYRSRARTYSRRRHYKKRYPKFYKRRHSKAMSLKSHFLSISKISETGSRRSVTLRYANGGQLPIIQLPNTVAVSSYTFAINDLHYFLRSEGTNPFSPPTPIARKDEWFDFYRAWRVNMIEVSLTVTNTQDQPCYVGLVMGKDSHSAASSWPVNWSNTHAIMRANTYCAMKLMGNANSSSGTAHLSMTIPIAKATGNPTYAEDPDFQGVGGTSPASPAKYYAMYIVLWSSNGGNPAFTMEFPIDLKVNFFTTMWTPDLEID